jgi:hypothetical protein
MTLAEERAFEREMQAIADAVSGILNEAPSLDAAPVGIALGGPSPEGRGAQHLPLARAHGRSGGLYRTRGPGRRRPSEWAVPRHGGARSLHGALPRGLVALGGDRAAGCQS